jgi:hypothetical protein
MRWNPNGDDSRPTIDDYLAETGHEEEAESYRMSTYAWSPLLTPDKKLRITKSSLGTFGWCRQQYYLEKFKGMRGEQQDHHIRGLNIHDMMEWFWANFTTEQEVEVLALADDVPKARQLFYSVFPTPPEPYIYGEDEQIAQWAEWQFQRLLHTGGKQWRPVGVEANIHATRYVEVDGEGIPVHMNGFIDTLFADDDTFALMELKSGKYSTRSKPGSMRKEMAFYKMMLEHSNHAEFLPITHWGWEFPGGGINGGDGPAIFYEKERATSMQSVEKALQKLVKAHIDMEFPPDPWMKRKLHDEETLEEMLERNALKCSWCDFKEHCSFWSLTDEFLDEIMEEEQ